MSGIYEIRNVLNNHRYIGSSVDIKKRWRDHKGISNPILVMLQMEKGRQPVGINGNLKR